MILKTLRLQPLHGFGIERGIEQITQNDFKENPGSLLTALQWLERHAAIDAEWCITENASRAGYYRLTRSGRQQLKGETTDWQQGAAVARLLSADS